MARMADIIDNTLSFLNYRRRAYQLTFNDNTEQGRTILKDLVEFSHWNQGPVGQTNEEVWRLIGRQDVIRRILQHTTLTAHQLMALYNGGQIPVVESNGDENDR